MMLFSGWALVRPNPPPPNSPRRCMALGSTAPDTSLEVQCPKLAGSPEFGHLLPQVSEDVEVERDASGNVVYVESP